MVVPLAFFLISWSFPIYLNIWKGKELDAYRDSHVGIEEGAIDADSRMASVVGSHGVGVTANEKDVETGKVEVKAQ
jgi:FHS family L-fucose permease-like MFS transporter